MQIPKELHGSFTLGEAGPMMERLLGLSSLVFMTREEDSSEWLEAPCDMTLEDFRHYAANDMGRIEGSLPEGGVGTETPELT